MPQIFGGGGEDTVRLKLIPGAGVSQDEWGGLAAEGDQGRERGSNHAKHVHDAMQINAFFYRRSHLSGTEARRWSRRLQHFYNFQNSGSIAEQEMERHI